MSFSDIIAQDHIIDHFRKTISSNHLSHSYLFSGQDGVGKRSFAKEFTKALLCKESNEDSCNVCNNCVRIEKGSHPDIHWIDIDKKSKFIKIEDIRSLKDSACLSPVESDYKIFIINDVDRMNEESANCLLKTLEEPSPNTIIILISNSIAAVKETIRSRCQVIRFHLIPTSDIQDQLIKTDDSDLDMAGWIARFCGGSLGKAFKLLEENIYERNIDFIKQISGLRINNLDYSEDLINSYLATRDSLEEKRQALKLFLNCILQLYRDLLIVKIRNSNHSRMSKTALFNADHEEDLRLCVHSVSREQITTLIDEILEFIRYIDYNLNINLLVENIFTRISVLHMKSTDNPHSN